MMKGKGNSSKYGNIITVQSKSLKYMLKGKDLLNFVIIFS